MSKIYLEILDAKRIKILTQLNRFQNIGYLAGGTGLALQLNHRKSYDFDWFVNKEIDNHLRSQIKDVFKNISVLIDNSDQISIITNNIRVTFVWYYYKTLFPFVSSPSINIASIEDIAADKAHTIGRRAIWRDYVDFYFLLKNKFSIADVIGYAKKKFRDDFNEILFLQQLCYFEDLEMTPIDYIKTRPSENEIKDFLTERVKQYTKSTL